MATEQLLQELRQAEERVWQALVSGDAVADAAALDAAFLGVYPSGFSDRAGHVGQLADGPVMEHFRLSDPRVLDLRGGLALLAYRADFRRKGAVRDEAMYISSLWRRDPSGWVNLFSQDTPVPGTGVPDTGVPDTGRPDTGPPD